MKYTAKTLTDVPTKSRAVNMKLRILTLGLDCDFLSLQREFKEQNIRKYKVNQIRISDRHFIEPGSKKRNWIPYEIFISDGEHKILVKNYFVSSSPLILTAQNGSLYIRDKNTEKNLPIIIELVPLYLYAGKKHNGIPLSEYLQIVGQDRVSIIPFDGCEHWLTGHQCAFCGANPTRLKSLGIKPNVLEIGTSFHGDYEKWWGYHKKSFYTSFHYALRAFCKEDHWQPHQHLSVISGNLINLDFLWRRCIEVSAIVSQYIPLHETDSYFQIMPPKTLSLIDDVHRLGFQHLCFNLETYGLRRFQKVCPGKTKYYGYEHMIQALQYGVQIFGKGKVRNNFVLGSGPIEDLLQGVKDLARMGVVTDYSVFFPRPGSVWCHRKPPSIEDIHIFTQKLILLYYQYGYRPYCCELSSRSSVENEYFNGWA